MLKKYITLLAIIFACIGFKMADAREMIDKEIVVLRTIDKISAYTNTFEIPVGKTVKFGSSLFIKAKSCRKASPIDTPENAAFLQIWQRKPSEDTPTWVFSGWMFSSNPSISGIEHPVYDVWVIDCKSVRSSEDEEFIEEQSPDESDNGSEEEETQSSREEFILNE